MEDEYETLPTTSLEVIMAAGGLAGIMEHCVMFPLDSVKTRMQALSVPSANPWTVLSEMVSKEGALRPLRGMPAMVLGAGPAHALYFSCYEHVKRNLHEVFAASSIQPFIHGISGCVATLFHDGIMTPAEAIKQRMQMANSLYSSSLDCFRRTLSTEGVPALYRAYTTQLSMNVPFQSIHFMVYEFMQGLTNKDREYNPKAHMLSGAIAGGTAAAVTTPLDVCKTLLNTQDAGVLNSLNKSKVRGLIHAIKAVYGVAGFRGYFRGCSVRVLYSMPSTALSWSVYEFFKFFLQAKEDSYFESQSTNTQGISYNISYSKTATKVDNLSQNKADDCNQSFSGSTGSDSRNKMHINRVIANCFNSQK